MAETGQGLSITPRMCPQWLRLQQYPLSSNTSLWTGQWSLSRAKCSPAKALSMIGCTSWGPHLWHRSLLGDTSYQVMMRSSPTLALFLTQIHQAINLKGSEKALFWKRIWRIIWEGMMFWKHISLCKDCSSYFSGFVAGLHPSLCLCWKMFRLSQNFLCTFMTFFIHGYMFAKGTQSFLLRLLLPVPFLCLIVPLYPFISWFVSSASASPMWPSSVVFIQEEQHFGLLGHVLFCPALWTSPECTEG